MDLLVTLVNGFLPLANVTKSSILDVAGVYYLRLSLLWVFFTRCLSVMKNDETVRVSRSVLCKIIARRDIISGEKFRTPAIYLS